MDVVSHRTYCNALFIVFSSRCFRRAKMNTLTHTHLSTGNDFWQNRCPTRPNVVKTGDAG